MWGIFRNGLSGSQMNSRLEHVRYSRGEATLRYIECSRSRQIFHLTARKITPEDAAHRWWRNVEQKSIQPLTTVIKLEQQNSKQKCIPPMSILLLNAIGWYLKTISLLLTASKGATPVNYASATERQMAVRLSSSLIMSTFLIRFTTC